MLRRANAYAFQVLADRAFPKLKESMSHGISTFRDMSDDQVHDRIAGLEKQLGLVASEPQVLPTAAQDDRQCDPLGPTVPSKARLDETRQGTARHGC